MERIYLVVNTNLDQGYMGIHADGSSPAASEFAWGLIHDEIALVAALFNFGPVEEPEPGIRQICLGLEVAKPVGAEVTGDTIVLLDDCPHPRWMDLHPAFDFEALSRGETPPYIKRWLAFEPWAE